MGDDLLVNKVVVGTENLRGAKFSYDCKDFKLASRGTPCVEGVTCKQEKVCPKKPAGRATTKKPGLIDRIKGSLGLGGTKSTTTTTRSLLSQSGALLTTKSPNTTTTTSPPFRG